MTWRGTADVKDRIFAALVYALPLIYVAQYGVFLFEQFPFLRLIYLPLSPLLAIMGQIPFASLIIFFVLFMAVVRNERISHFIRFNTMQAILLDILVFLVGFLLSFLARGLGSGLLIETLFNVLFLGILAASFYAIAQSVLGRYAEIPSISEAVYAQVR